MSGTPNKNFYCSQKFTWLSVDVEKKLSYSCCAATPNKINIDWLKDNPGQLFATPELRQDRVDMLANRPVSSCQAVCWTPESRGLISQRQAMNTTEFVDLAVDVATPKSLNIILGSTCNLTCSYCCKQYSSSWVRDLEHNNNYPTYENRYRLTPTDQIKLKISHDQYQQSTAYETIINEISNFKNCEEILITGGEPFLYNNLPELLNQLTDSKRVIVVTGLGVNSKRMQKQFEKINLRDNLQINVSAENCDKFYEFNRYGNTYDNFLTNLKLLTDQHFSVKFLSVVSNLTVFGLEDFSTKFQDYPIEYSFCNDPDFLSVNVLDDASKIKLAESLNKSQLPTSDKIISNLQQPYSDQQKTQFAQFIKTFASRRNLSLDIFPSGMLQWLDS